MRPTELLAHRRQTAALIQANPVTAKINRPTKVNSEAGGKSLGEPNPLPNQTFMLTSWTGGFQVQEFAGLAQENLSLLVGPHDLDLQVDDWFVHNNERFDCVWIDPARSYRTAAAMARKGVANA